MNRTSLSMMLCAALLAAPAAFGADLTAAQIAEKNAAARGGLQAWRAVSTLTMSGEMDAGGKQDVKLPFVLSMKRSHKSRLEIRFQEQTAVQTFDGTKGWKFRPFQGRNDVDPLTPAETKSVAAADELDGPLIDYAAKGVKVELQGMDVVDGKDAYKLRLTQKNGEQRNLWIDASSFLDVKVDGEPRRLDGKMHPVAIVFRDYKTLGGLTLAHTLETVVQGVKETHKMTIQKVAVNPKLEDSLFAKPQPVVGKAPAL